MNPDSWRRAEELYHSALEMPPGQRMAYLAEACDQDLQLRAEVESMVRNAEDGTFLERPAIEIAAMQYASAIMPDVEGRKLGRYEVISRIGSGGMGEVYLAHDSRLKRQVALKVLRPENVADPERMRRFVQEARAASALRHPNIVAIYDIDQIEGIDFIAMEYVSGTTLDKIIGRQGVPPAKVLQYAIQIADALATAHAARIVHRDLKPGNIVIDDRDVVKIVDFGLAKLIEGPSAGEPAKSLETTKGIIIGTAAYMSPEQTEGKAVDGRSDVFSFGAVLYEMLTGKPAFLRETASATVAAILRDDPKPISQLRSKAAGALEHIVGRCLRKDPNRRFQTMADAKTALQDLQQELQTAIPTLSPGTKRRLYLLAATAFLLTATGLTLFLQKKPARRSHEIRRLTFDSTLSWHPAVSPDGKYVAYASERGSSALHIWIQELPNGDPVRLTKDEANEDYPAFSPDGRKIAFRSDRGAGGIYVTSLLGGEPKLLASNATRPQYSPNGQLLLFALPGGEHGPGGEEKPYTRAFLMPADGGARRQLRTECDAQGYPYYSHPVWSPDGGELLYMVARAAGLRWLTHWCILPVSAGQPVSIDLPDQLGHRTDLFKRPPMPLAWLRDDRVLFSAPSGDAVNLWSGRLSSSKRRVTEPLDQLTFGTGNINYASAANNGAVVFGSVTAQTRLWLLPLEKGESQSRGDPIALLSDGEIDAWPSLSDTGKLAYLSWKAGKWNLWLRDLQSGRATWLASPNGNYYQVSTLVNREGSRVVYTNCEGIPCSISAIAPGGGLPEKVCEDCGQLRSWSSDGSVILSQNDMFEGSKYIGTRIYRIDVRERRKTVLLEKRGRLLFSPDVSPDGRWVAFQSPVTKEPFEHIFIAPVDARSRVESDRWIAVTNQEYFDANPEWSRNGKLLYFLSDRDGFSCLWAVTLDLATKKPLGKPFALKHFHGNPQHYMNFPTYSVGPDRIVISLEEVRSDLWMVPEGG